MKAWCHRIVRANLATPHSLYRHRRGSRSMALIRSSIWARASPPTPSRGARPEASRNALLPSSHVYTWKHVAVTAARCGSDAQRVGAGHAITHDRPVHGRRPSVHHGQRSGPFSHRFDTFSRFRVGLSAPAPLEGKPFDFCPSNVFSMSIAEVQVRWLGVWVAKPKSPYFPLSCCACTVRR